MGDAGTPPDAGRDGGPDGGIVDGGVDGGTDAGMDAGVVACGAPETITTTHRHSPNIYGGWGTHLGHLLRSDTGELWYVDDTGSDVNVNAGLAYYRRTGTTWSQAGANAFPGTVQQNTGSLMSGHTIFTYGIDIANDHVVECTLDTTNPSAASCASLPFDTGAASNYVGATISKNGTRVVWWTNATTSASWSYLYNFGGGWNGPQTAQLPGYADFSYVYARLAPDDARLELHGASAHVLGGASGGYDAIYASTMLGTPVSNWLLVASDAIALETWLDPLGGTHLFTYESAGISLYSYKASSAALMNGQTLSESGLFTARIVEAGPRALLVVGFTDGTVRYKAVDVASVSGAVDWNAISDGTIALPSGLGDITVFPESAMYQDTPPGFAFAINGTGDEGTISFVSCE
jgi:hypothetical protein